MQKAPMIVTVLGKSGTGKSTSMRNLDPKSTAIISTDSKPLPFRGGDKMQVVQVDGKEPEKLLGLLKKLRDREDIETIVIDAFTQFGESLTYFCNKKYKGFDRITNYNNIVFELFELLKTLEGKTIFIFGHPVIGETAEGEDTITAKVDNKQRKGIIEERSTILLMARVLKGDTGVKYVFETEGSDKTPVKAPMGLFTPEEREIDNDLKLVSDKITEYYK